MTLRDQILGDNRSIFFALDDFAVEREINGRAMKVVEDGDQLLLYRRLGIYEGTLLIYVQATDMPGPVAPGAALIYDRVKWYVEDCREDMGVLEVVLKRNAGGGIGR